MTCKSKLQDFSNTWGLFHGLSEPGNFKFKILVFSRIYRKPGFSISEVTRTVLIGISSRGKLNNIKEMLNY